MPTIEGILRSQFARKSVETTLVQRNGRPCAANFLRELLEEIDRLAQYCQLSEFTEHGLPHLESLVDRIQTWTRVDGTHLLDELNADEAFLLFFAVLCHDIGMLTQREDDLHEDDRAKYARVFADLPSWVRRTHVPRLEGVLRRLFNDRYPEFLASNLFALGVSLARSHQYWPGEAGYQELEHLALKAGFGPDRVKAMAGVLAVADLLDEDSGRCDTMTLFANKAGNLMNRAHWLRHLLTADRLRVVRGVVTVQIRVPINLEGQVDTAPEGLRNHLRLAQVYNNVLGALRAEILLQFPDPLRYDPVPEEPPLELLLCEPDIHLMRTLPDEALPPATETEPPGSDVVVMGVTLKRVDRSVLDHALGPVGSRSGRTDFEITYAAASLRGEDNRRRALKLLRNAAAEANARGDITMVRRLSTLVLQDLTNNKSRPLTDALWAAVYTLHWARHEHDLLAVERLLETRAEDGTKPGDQPMDRGLANLPLPWQVVGLTTHVLLLRRRIAWQELTTLIERRTEWREAALSPEEQVAWHDLFEALWAVGYLKQYPAEEFTALFARLQELERLHLPPSQRLLAELAWRMAVQSRCLSGYGRWEAPAGSMDRSEYGLPSDPGREAMAKVWMAWFEAQGNGLKEVARQARRSNPPGSELYVSALEAEWLVSNVGIDARLSDDDALHRRQEFMDATDRDDAYRLVNSTVTSVLDVNLEPRKEGTIYFGGRGTELQRYEVILGERVSLRRWYLGSFHKVVGYNLRTTLSLAHTLHLEGDQVIHPVLGAIQDLPWGSPYAGKSRELLEVLWPRVEPYVQASDLVPVLEMIARSPRRIGNIRHPGIKILGDALTSEMLPVLVEWTNRELQDPIDLLWPSTFEVWPDIMEHGDVPPEIWDGLGPLLKHSLQRMHRGDTNAKIVRAAIARAPWSVAGPLVRRIAEALQQADCDPDWMTAAKEAVGDGLLRRQSEDWHGTDEHQTLLAALERLTVTNNDPDDQILVQFLSGPTPQEGYDQIAERWLERLETVRDRAVARENWNGVSLGLPGYPVGPSRPIGDEMAIRAAKALDELWAADYATIWEIEVGTGAAALLFRASEGAGRQALARSLLAVMSSNRTALGFIDPEACAPIAWRKVAPHSTHFPADTLPELGRLLVQRLIDLPLEAAWAQARIAMEVLLRTKDTDLQQLAQSALLSIRARTAEQPRWGAQALVAGAQRLLEEENWPLKAEEALDLLAGWAEKSSVAPVPHVREAVARICNKLAQRVTGKVGERLNQTLERLRNDVRMRVRKAAAGQED
jgi:hypothetical protein